MDSRDNALFRVGARRRRSVGARSRETRMGGRRILITGPEMEIAPIVEVQATLDRVYEL